MNHQINNQGGNKMYQTKYKIDRVLSASEEKYLNELSGEYYYKYKMALGSRLLVISSAILLAIFCLGFLNSYAQEPAMKTLVRFNATYAKGSVYIKWGMKNETQDGIFVLERSFDKQEFKAIGLKQAIGSPLKAEIMYCWIDDQPGNSAHAFYRLSLYGNDGSLLGIAPIITIVNPLDLKKEAEALSRKDNIETTLNQ